MRNEEFARTEAGKVWAVFKENGHACYASWLIEALAEQSKKQNIEME